MAKPLLVRTDRSPALKLPLSASTGGQALSVTIALQIVVHTVPEGYRDEIHVWWNNTDAAIVGSLLMRLGATAANDIIVLAPFREIIKVLDGFLVEGVDGGLDIEALALTEPGKIWGHVIRSPIVA